MKSLNAGTFFRLKKVNGLVCLVAIVLVALAQESFGQDSPPEVYYSQLTQSFDGQPPIGKRFKLKGVVDQVVTAVEVESFGFPSSSAVPREFTTQVTTEKFCEALERSRTRSDVLRMRVAWERGREAQGNSTRMFEVNHPRLYYGRTYLFLFKYYTDVAKSELQDAAESAVKRVLTNNSRPTDLDRLLLDPQEMKRELEREFTGLGLTTCPTTLINRSTKLPITAGDLFTLEALQFIAGQVQAAHDAQQIRDLLPANGLDGEWLDSISHEDIKEGEADTAQTTIRRLKDSLAAANDARTADSWSTVSIEAATLASLLVNGSPAHALASELMISAGQIGNAFYKQPPGIDVDSLSALIATSLDLPDREEFLSASVVSPYLETMQERHPFIMSLDGGLLWVTRFEEIVPTIGVNLKLNRVDFNDPIDRTPEYSVVFGLGMNAPDDLDPDYLGIIGSRSLVVGLGIRAPSISRLLRLQVGAVLYRQESENPLEDDASTRASLYAGISLNWDAIDFATGLFRNRSSFQIDN